VQYGNTYVQNQYNGHTLGSQQHSGNINQRIDFVQALAFDQMDSRYEGIDPAHVNTCQWLFQKPEYVQWRDPEQLASHNGFLWIKGKAGSGKSTLMKCAFEHARKSFHNDKVIAFFFNARGQPLERSVEGMYRSLLLQILRHFPEIRPEFPTYGPGSVQQQGWTVPALRNHLYRAVSSLRQGEAMTFYIDALDECDEDDTREALEHFEELGSVAVSVPIALHICFASRYYPRATIQHCVEIHLEEQSEHKQDIKKYINGKLAIRDITFKAQLASEIEARASGVFLWVVLVIRLIRKRCDGGASHSEISKSLQEVPDKLQELIGTVLHSPDDALLCTMRWMLFAKGPLDLGGLYFAIRTGMGQLTSAFWDTSEVNHSAMEAFVIAASRGLVEIKSYEWGGNRAHLVHESVREYIITGGLKGIGCCSDKIVEANNDAKLFEWCQTYLVSIPEEYVATIEDRDTWSLDDIRQTYPLLTYAGSHILDHFAVACIAGVLRSSSLHKFPVRQWIYLDLLTDEIGLGVYHKLLEPHRLLTSLLYVSIIRGDVQFAEALLAENAMHSPRIKNQCFTSATASNSGLPVAKIDLNLYFEESCPSLLELAISRRSPSLVRPLLDRGADPNIDGGAPLYTAAAELYCFGEGMEDVLRLLLSRGAHAQAFRMPHGTTALTLAAGHGSLALVTLLLEHGADANGANGTPAVSPLLAALGHSFQVYMRSDDYYDEISLDPIDEDVVRTLLQHGADVHLRAGPEQISPLQYATERFTGVNGGMEIIQLLTSYGQRDVQGSDLSLVPTAREMD
jgi:hypothetical protein